ncbi:MAG: hypothetical protein KIS78_05165 [Labilithrix sp.]|nr:hypothetical protein [Labilithrix sp.]
MPSSPRTGVDIHTSVARSTGAAGTTGTDQNGGSSPPNGCLDGGRLPELVRRPPNAMVPTLKLITPNTAATTAPVETFFAGRGREGIPSAGGTGAGNEACGGDPCGPRGCCSSARTSRTTARSWVLPIAIRFTRPQ